MNEDLRGPASALAKLGVFSAALVALPLSAVSLTLGGYLDRADSCIRRFCGAAWYQQHSILMQFLYLRSPVASDTKQP